MKKLIKTIIFILFIGLILSNVYIFVAGINASNEIVRLEKKLDKLRQDNIELDTQLGQVDSLEYAASMAASFDFEKKAVPLYLDGLKYALNR